MQQNNQNNTFWGLLRPLSNVTNVIYNAAINTVGFIWQQNQEIPRLQENNQEIIDSSNFNINESTNINENNLQSNKKLVCFDFDDTITSVHIHNMFAKKNIDGFGWDKTITHEGVQYREGCLILNGEKVYKSKGINSLIEDEDAKKNLDKFNEEGDIKVAKKIKM